MKLEVGGVKSSVFLLQLREEICEELSHILYQYVDVFLNVLRDSNHKEASKYQVCNSEFVTLIL